MLANKPEICDLFLFLSHVIDMYNDDLTQTK